MNTKLKKKKITILNWCGSGLAILGIIFVGLHLHEYGIKFDRAYLTTGNVFLIITLTLLYGVSSILPCLAWRKIILMLGSSINPKQAIYIYGTSQLAKYIPGNIFHFAGRQAMGMSVGLPSGVLLKSTIWELGLLCISGAILSTLTLPYIIDINYYITLLCTVIISSVFYFYLKMRKYKVLAEAYVLYSLFLIIAGVVFYSLLTTLNNGVPLGREQFIPLVGGYIFSWLIGLIIPGAPAGVGIREMILLFLLKGKVNEQELLFIILIGRVITVCGDITLYIISNGLKIIKMREKKQ